MTGYMYILECADGSYYTGSTTNLISRLAQHQNGEGANHIKKRLPVKLVYLEEYPRIDFAFYREKQVQGWNRKKKQALINGETIKLPELAIAYRDKVLISKFLSVPDTTVPSRASGIVTSGIQGTNQFNSKSTENTVPETLEGTVQ